MTGKEVTKGPIKPADLVVAQQPEAYRRDDGASMIEIEPHVYVNGALWWSLAAIWEAAHKKKRENGIPSN